MKNISDFKKKFKVANLEFKKVTDQDGNASKWLKAVANDIIIICDPKQKVTLTSPIKEIKPGTWMVTKVYTSTVVFTV